MKDIIRQFGNVGLFHYAYSILRGEGRHSHDEYISHTRRAAVNLKVTDFDFW